VKHNGFVFYDGPSMLDGKPILGIATGLKQTRTNTKTGAMIQTYILRKEENPVIAHKRGLDASVCGDCLHRTLGTCYVRLENGPLQVYRAYQRGGYPHLTLQESRTLLVGRIVRLGAYGDPAAIPFATWETILDCAHNWTGYTHQWKAEPFAPFQRFTMASCDTDAEYQEAKALGWRAFYVVPQGYSGKPQGAFLCPASEQAGKKLTCIDCTACNGTQGKATASVFIPVHGVGFKQTRFSNLIQIGKASH